MKKGFIIIFVLFGLMILTGTFLIIANETDQEKGLNTSESKNSEEKKSIPEFVGLQQVEIDFD